MDKIKQTGNKIAKIKRESNQNARRKAENFVQPEASVGSVSALRPYQFTFTGHPNCSVFLNLAIKDSIVTCTMEPPPIDVHCTARISGDATNAWTGGAHITEIISTTSNIIPGQPDFFLKKLYRIDGTTNQIIQKGWGVCLPVDGCYNVKWESNYWGVSYFETGGVSVNITHSIAYLDDYYWEQPVLTMSPINMSGSADSSQWTGIIATLGPLIFVYSSPSPIWGITEARADDVIDASIYANSTDWGAYRTPYPWPNGGLYGAYWDLGATLEITLTAVADLPKRPEDEPAYGLEPSGKGIVEGYVKGYYLYRYNALSPWYHEAYVGPVAGAKIQMGEWNRLDLGEPIAYADDNGYYKVILDAGVYTLTAHNVQQLEEALWGGWPELSATLRVYPGRVTRVDFPLTIIKSEYWDDIQEPSGSLVLTASSGNQTVYLTWVDTP